ncbi:SdpI family protein [Bifidobacterium sp. ESL0763]|uniref:SdpI family protein n=1 Tax=Bifidobacterium sp. ESL0763 TaxID=2983227 RepID=UPI0023F9ED83|nr:SdpI family protein [Bifidobacterium sp. ESL0763]MDF7663855.1 SdpI family protein [Bifidobacterium sp. ESL0763]
MSDDTKERKSPTESEHGDNPEIKGLEDAEKRERGNNGWKAVFTGARNWNIAMVVLGTLPLIVYLLALPYMPARVPMHYNAHGELDSWGGKGEWLFFPLFTLLVCLVWLVCEIPVERSARKQSNAGMSAKTTVRVWIIGGCCMFTVLNVLNVWFIADAFGKGSGWSAIPLEAILNVATGLVFIVIGNVMPHTRMNRWSGIRVPEAFKSRESWRRCQRFGGFAFILGGVLLVVVGLAMHAYDVVGLYAILVVALVIAVVCSVYGIYAGKKYGNIGGPIRDR